MKLAAVDLGSNSIHMLIVDVAASGGFRVIARERAMVRLGAETLASGSLPASAARRGIEVLSEYKRLADNHEVDQIVAVATSAIREARNGEDFLDRAGRELGVWAKAISGEEEARLIYLAALHSIHLEGRRTLVMDLGGGSLELALGAGKRVEWTASEKLGVVRLSELLVKSDPLSAKDEARLERHVEAALAPHAARVRRDGFDCAVGTSGTILALGGLACEMETGRRPESLHHVSVRAETVSALRRRLVASTLRERRKLPGLDERRGDIIVAGAVVLDLALSRLGVKQLLLSDWALREGILLDFIHGNPRSLARAEAYPDVRRRSVVALAERCAYDAPHAEQVARLALELFDATRERHGLGARERALLEHAALLHDVGHHIAYPGHHRHSYYLIKNGGLRGFDPREIEMIASVARFHRSGRPTRRHAGVASLDREARRSVRLLAGCLRIADALDRSHRQVVRGVAAAENGEVLRLRLEVEGDCQLELWGVARRTALLERELGLSVRVEARPVASSPAASDEKPPEVASRAARSEAR